jgi:hypothetical protein
LLYAPVSVRSVRLNCYGGQIVEKNEVLGLLFEELVEARKRASWYVAALVIKSSLAQAGVDEPPSNSEIDNLQAILTNLRSICEETQLLLKQ